MERERETQEDKRRGGDWAWKGHSASPSLSFTSFFFLALFKELIKATPETHPDRRTLSQALSSVEQLATFINETKKDHDNLKQLISSLNGYRGKPIQEFGTMVKDGDLMFKSTAGKEKMKPR